MSFRQYKSSTAHTIIYMTSQLSKLAQYLYSDNPEMAIQLHKNNRYALPNQPQPVLLLLAKAYFVQSDYQHCIDLLATLKDSKNIVIHYQARMLLFKTKYLSGQSTARILDGVKERIQREVKDTSIHKRLTTAINQSIRISAIGSGVDSNVMIKTQSLKGQRQQFQQLMRTQDDHSIIMQGMPMFLVPQKWFQKWQQFTNSSQRIQVQRKHPGPITQFQILDHPFNFFMDQTPGKQYTNRYILNGTRYRVLPKKCWQFLKEKYDGIDLKRYNISSVDKPYEIMTEILLRKIQIARYQNKVTPSFTTVQITRKENWEGLRQKLFKSWGKGGVYEYQGGKVGARINDGDILEQVDTMQKQYVYMADQGKQQQGQKCGNKQCGKRGNLRWCQCKTIKYCGMDCLKADLKNHRKKCQLEMTHQKQQGAVFKNFKLQQRDYGGRRGLVGLKNLGNTCYMNSGLQCLSNTRQITQYFMKDDFKSHINYTNPLGTKGNLACAYAQLIRQMWTGSSDVVSPFKLKKMIGNFAAQFAGYGQQDSQELISYLIDGLQEDLNLVKNKQTFQTSDDIKPDEEMSRQAELNFAKRINSYIRSLMAGQFKSTVVCRVCKKVSVCFDPYLLVSLPIPASEQWELYFLPSDVSKSAIKFSFDFSQTTDLTTIAAQLARAVNNKAQYSRQKQEKVQKDRLLFCIVQGDKFEVTRILQGKQTIRSIKGVDHLFCLQIPAGDDQEIVMTRFLYKGEHISFPRFVKIARKSSTSQREAAIIKAVQRGLQKSQKAVYSQLVKQEKLRETKPFKTIEVTLQTKLKLLVYIQSHNAGFKGKLIQNDQKSLSIEDCLSNFATQQALQKDNSWYCNKCKQFQPALKQMQIYKGNQILVLAFKRFSRLRKIRTPIKFPLDGLNMGPYFLSNTSKKPLFYDLYAVVNHYGSLGGGHYTAYCQNFLNKRWYQFNDSHVQEIKKGDIVSGDSYVLFLRKRD